MIDTQTRVVLAARPDGVPRLTDFAVDTASMPVPLDGEVLLRTIYLSLDPYLRGRMGSSASHASVSAPVALGTVMEGGTIAEVVVSRAPALAPGDLVVGTSGWQQYAAAPAATCRRLDPALAPISTALGVLGMPGFTGYAGLREVGRPAAGDTVVVAAATGTVGSLVGQLARIGGARSVGIAGGARKCDWLRKAGFDAVVDHQEPSFADLLAAATPDGIDVYFENVGGPVWDAVWPRLNRYARVPVCGVASAYNAAAPAHRADVAGLMSGLVTRSITLRGFVYRDFEELRPRFEEEVSGYLRSGAVIHHEEVVDGLTEAPAAFLGLLAGEHLGKRLVRVGADPTLG